jgi:hypothetical protein
LQKDTAEALKYYQDVIDAIKKLESLKVSPGNYVDLINKQKEAISTTDKLTTAVDNLSKAQAGNANSTKATAQANSDSSKSFTQNTAAVEANIAKQKELKKELEGIAATRKQLNDFNGKVNFDGNEAAKVQIEKQLLDFSERELQIRKELSELNTQLQGNAVSDPEHFQGNDLDAAAKAKALEKEQTRQLNTELKAQAQYELATAGSINEAKAAVSLMIKERDSLNLKTEDGVKRQTELNTKIDEYNAFIKENNDLLGKQRLNVGNYPSSFGGAFTALKAELANVKEALNDPALSGEQLKSLENEQKLLTQLTENLGQQFTSTREELRAYQEAAKQLGLSLGDDNKLFHQFAAEVGSVKDEIGDLQARINFNSSDTKYIDGAIEAVNGLAGAYSAAEGAVQLFGDEDKDVQKGMQKLQALIAITTGLQQVQNAIQSESAAMQTILAAKTNLLAAARSLLGSKIKEETAAVIADTTAQEANTAAIVANATAAEGSTVAGATEQDVSLIDEAAAAQEQLSTATETVGTATEAVTTIKEAAAPITKLNTVATEEETAAESRSGIVKLVLLARLRLLAAAKRLLGTATAQNVVATEAEAAAQASSIAATQGAAVANTELAASAEGATVAMGEEAVATETATAATATFAEAFAATGIGALILAVGAALVYAIVKLNDYANASYQAYQQNVDFTASIKDVYDTLQKQGQLVDEYNKQQTQNLQNQAAISAAAGQNKSQEFAMNAKLLQQRKEMADSRLANLIAENEKKYSAEGLKGTDALKKAQDDYLIHYDHYLGQIKTVQNDLQKLTVNNDLSDSEKATKKEALTGLLTDLQKQADGVKAGYDVISKAQSDVASTSLDVVTNQVGQIAYLNEEERKLTLATTEWEVSNIKSRNERILADTQSSFDERRKAIQSNADAEIRIARAQADDIIKNPTSSDNDRLIAEKLFHDKRLEIIRTSHDAIDTENENENNRLIAADKAMYDTRIKAQQEFYSKAAQDPNLSFSQQVAAFDKAQQLQQQQIISDHEADEKIKNQSFRTNEEKAADEAAFQQQLIDLAQKGAEGRLKFIEDYNKRVQAETNAAQSALKNAIQGIYVSDVETSEQYASDVKALDESLKKKEISLTEYNHKRRDLDDDYNIYSLTSQLAKDRNELASVQHTTQEELALRQKIANEEIALAEKTAEKQKEAAQQVAEAEKQLLDDILTLGQTIGDASFQRKIDGYQKLMDASNKYYDTEISNIANSARIGAITDQQAADRTTILNAEKAAKADQYDKKERDMKTKQARFDKMASLARIAASTAEAIMKTYATFGFPLGTPLALAQGAIGLAEAAIVLATPLPTYKYGLKGNKGAHFGVYGEAGAELVEKPGFAPFIADKATIDYLPARTKITPLKAAEVDEMLNRTMMMQTAALLDKKAPKADNSVLDAINHQTKQLAKAIQKGKTSIHIHDNAAYLAWKQKRTNW